MNKKILVLDNIRSVHNVGAMFRTAEAAGVDEILLCGITPGPLDRFGRPRSDVAKASVGAHEMVSWQQMTDAQTAIEYLQQQNTQIISMEINDTSIDYKTVAPDANRSVAIVMGNENTGVSDEWLQVSDVVAHIPMAGEKESLNVSTTCGIALFRIFDL